MLVRGLGSLVVGAAALSALSLPACGGDITEPTRPLEELLVDIEANVGMANEIHLNNGPVTVTLSVAPNLNPTWYLTNLNAPGDSVSFGTGSSANVTFTDAGTVWRITASVSRAQDGRVFQDSYIIQAMEGPAAIAFIRIDENSESRIQLIDPAHLESIRTIVEGLDVRSSDLSWNEEGTHLAFTTAGALSISSGYTYNRITGETRNITNLPSGITHLTFGPNDQLAAFYDKRAPGTGTFLPAFRELVIIDYDSTIITEANITYMTPEVDEGFTGNSIVWLNGETIAIGDNPDPEREAGSRILVVYDVNSGNPRGQPLASDLAGFARVHEMDMPTILMGAHGVTITPDKKTIAYSLNDWPINNGFMTVAQDVNGGQLSLITNGVEPSYTADGEFILVSRGRFTGVQLPATQFTTTQLFRVSLRTGASRRITELLGSWHSSPAFTLGPVAENIASQTSKGTPTARPARSE